jgi:Caspase domain
MKTTLVAALSLAMFFTSTPLAQRRDMVAVKNKRVALVIGNAAYKESPLSNPVNDAKDMAQLLTELGFQVIYKQNSSQAEMKSAIREFGNNISKGDVALFYFAGHGAQVNGENYLIPVGAVITKEEEVEYESVNAGLVLAQMASAANRLNIVILDACRNNPFARSSRSQTRGLAQMNAPTGTIIAYATEPGSVAADGRGKNGLYTEELLKAMRAPGLKIEDTFKRVRVGVRTRSQGKQTPWESSSLEGDFYFIQPGNNAPQVVERAETPIQTADVSSIELKFWESIEKSDNPKDFEAYIKKYPNGNFVELANNRLESLEAAKKDSTPAPAPAATNSSSPSASSPNSSGGVNAFREEQPNVYVFKLIHDRSFFGSPESGHHGTLSITPGKMQWEEDGATGDQKDKFSASCSDISKIITMGMFSIKLKDKKINQNGRGLFSFYLPEQLTAGEVVSAIRVACPRVKVDPLF